MSAEWLALRRQKLQQNPVCEYCGKARAYLVDHIIPIRLGGERLDMNNLKSSCVRCHSRKRREEARL